MVSWLMARILILVAAALVASCTVPPCPPEQRAVTDICAAATSSYCARCRACGTCGADCESAVACKVPAGLDCDTDDAWLECIETLVDPDCTAPTDCPFLATP